ncbi:MAG: aspartyl-phosphate phosphatase Spo0E family protein [Firmicutes bacterium]|nr:aspartyl-phosphate phosphatase Spo0E family protein [Bacillota bacterium]
MLTPGKVILQIEKAWNRLLSIDPSEKEKLLAASKKVDRLIIEYYRAKSCTEFRNNFGRE